MYEQNWPRGWVPLGRGDGEEYRGVAGWTIRSPELRRRPWRRRQAAVHGAGAVGGERERAKGTGWCAFSP